MSIYKCFFLVLFNLSFAQTGFLLTKNESTKIPFQFINNQIIIDVVINNTTLKFIVDSGVEETLIFSLDQNEYLKVNNPLPIKFKGLGANEPIQGLKSENNNIQIGKHFSDDKHTVFIILNQDIDLSSTMGIPINGIIGYQFFKNYAVEINYSSKKIILHQNDSKKLQKRKNNYQKHEIQILKNKPFLYTTVHFENVYETGHFLLDTGNSDVIWLFNQQFLASREKKLYDFLGKGFSGDVHGYRFRTININVLNQSFKSPILVIPDSLSIQNVHYIENRKGSMGSGFISRFDVIFDYPNQTFYSQNTKRLKNPFLFNRSGIEIVVGGTALYAEKVTLNPINSYGMSTSTSNNVTIDIRATGSKLVEKPIYVIHHVRENLNVAYSKIKKGDIIETINGKMAKNLSLQDINNMLQSPEHKSIHLTLSRTNKTFVVEIPLQDLL